MKIKILLLAAMLYLTGCATLERWVDDVYDGDPRMTDIKERVDALKVLVKDVAKEKRSKLKAELEIAREEAEMLGDLKKREFEIKLAEIKARLAAVKQIIESAQ